MKKNLPNIYRRIHVVLQNLPSNDTTEQLNKLRPMDFPPWKRLSLYHWSSILAAYNISIAGEQITILPTIKLSHAVNLQTAKQLSNPNDVQQFQWPSFASAAFDPLDFSGKSNLSYFEFSIK